MMRTCEGRAEPVPAFAAGLGALLLSRVLNAESRQVGQEEQGEESLKQEIGNEWGQN